MADFKKYISKFVKNNQENSTHVAFNKGKYNVPDTCFAEFYKTYHQSLIKGEELFIIEQVNNCKFAYFLDIDSPKENNFTLEKKHVLDIINIVKENVVKMFNLSQKEKELDYTISQRTINANCIKYHVNYPNLILNSNIAQILTKNVIADAKARYTVDLCKAIDFSVYRTGLRLFGSKKTDTKKERENFGDAHYQSTYTLLLEDQEVKLKDTTFEMFKKCIVRRKFDTKLTEIKEEFAKEVTKVVKVKPKTKVNVQNNEIHDLIHEVCDINSDKTFITSFKDSIAKVTSPQSSDGIFSYYIGINGNDVYCPFKKRCHKRESCPIYLELNSYGLFLRCYDEDCNKEKLELKLPVTFQNDYPNLYLSINNKYWKSEIELTPKIRKVLEDSLNMSHFKIAKVAFNIYKERFRIDDIKNPDWYEFDGNKWKKTHNMNILISEELKKYYNAIRTVPEEECEGEEGEDNGDEKAKKNIKNDIIDNIINKLENVTFKKSVLNEMYYLFKSFEPDFISKLDANPYLIGFKNGVYDFEKCEFREGKPEDYLTFSTNYDFTEYDQSCTEVKEIYEFLAKIIPNKKVMEYLLKILGRSLIGIPDEHFYIFTGSGANGKSTLFNILEDVLCDYNTAVDVALLTNNRALSSSASPDVFRTKGKRQLTFAEPEYGQTLKTGLMKAFTGGDTIVSRELYKAPITFKLQASLFLACNDLPNLSSIDGGTMRRIRVIEFKSRFCDNPKKANEYHIDPDVKQKSRLWRPYFMSILMHYYQIYISEIKQFGKIEEPEEVKIATNRYKNDNDKFNDFFEECVTFNENYEILNIRIIYGLFSNWWISNNTVSNKVPEIKELVRAMKLKYDDDTVKGFRVKVNLQSNIETELDSDKENY
jgi:P4 family phage/plasmid primase-like protien